jgi:hypothetical protein
MTHASRFVSTLFVCVAGTCQANALPIDFSSQAGLEATCPRLRDAKPNALVRNDDRAAYAICSAIALATDAMTWWRQDERKFQLQRKEDRDLVRARAESYLSRIAAIRSALEGIKATKPLFVIEPGKWTVDLDGDGAISMQERYFFWTPKRGLDMSPMARAASEENYRSLYIAPVINVDPSDIYWAIAYCDFAEAALNLALSYDLLDGNQVKLVDAARVRSRAYPRLLAGLRYSAKLRESLLAETHDDREWIPNPRQTHTSFPLVMDAQTFATWGDFLKELQGLAEGKTLLGAAPAGHSMDGTVNLTFGICEAGKGLDVRDLFMRPLPQALDMRELQSRCLAPTPARPMSGLAPLVYATALRNADPQNSASGESVLLRHLFWVN